MQQITKAHVPEKFRPYPVGDTIYNLCPVICRIDVHAERTPRKRRVHYLYDAVRDLCNISIGNRLVKGVME